MSIITLNLDSQQFLRIAGARKEKLLGEKELTDFPIETARELFLKLTAPAEELPPIAMDVIDTSFTYDSVRIPMRVYKPARKNQLLPAIVFFHGGGFVLGDLDFIDYSCRLLTNYTQCIVISVDYRRAPEHKFPAAHQDCYQATKYIQMNPEQFGCNGVIAVGGESAGGNLAASICHMAKQSNEIKIDAQILYYPWVNLNNDSESDKKFAKGYLLETPALNWMREQYLTSIDEYKDPIANPLLQNDFHDLPPALILAAGCDPIHDESKRYFEKLIDANVDAQFIEFGGVLHGFFALTSYYQAAYASFSLVAEMLKYHLIDQD